MNTRTAALCVMALLLQACASTGRPVTLPEKGGSLKTKNGLEIKIDALTTELPYVEYGIYQYSPRRLDAFLAKMDVTVTNTTSEPVKPSFKKNIELIVLTKDNKPDVCGDGGDMREMRMMTPWDQKDLEPSQSKTYSLIFTHDPAAIVCAVSYAREDLYMVIPEKSPACGIVTEYFARLKSIEGLVALCSWAPFVVVDKYISEYKFDYEIRNKNGLTPFLAAALNGNVNLGEGLLGKGVDIHSKVYFSSEEVEAIHLASIAGHADFVGLLINRNVDIGTATNYKNTPLHFAVSYNRVPVVKRLIEAGADIQSVIFKGMGPPLSPYKYAVMHHFTELAAYLQSIGVTE